MKKYKKKFCVIAKIDSVNFVKYRTDNIENCLLFLKNKYVGLRYANIFSNRGINENKLLYTYGKIKGLQNAN